MHLLAFFFALLFCTCSASSVNAAPEANELPDANERNAPSKDETREELLLFFEEKDLVAATRRKTPLHKAPATATVITADEIRVSGARSLTDVLKLLSSIGVSTDEFGRRMIEVRGIRTITSEKILVMIDGHSLNETWTGSAFANLFDDLPVGHIKQVEIIQGPGSALYGANAFVAVVNVVTKDPEDVNGVLATATAGSFNTRGGNLLAGASGEGLRFMGNFDYFDSDGPKLKIEQDRLTLAGSPASRVPGETDRHIKKTDLFVKASAGDITFSGHYLKRQRGAYIGFFYALTDENDLRYDNSWGELRYRKDLGSGLSLKARTYVDQFKLGSAFEIYPEGAPAPVFPEGMLAKTELTDRTVGAELQMEWAAAADNHLVAGVQYERTRQFDVKFSTNFNPLTNAPLGSFQNVSGLANFNQDARRQLTAVFAQDEWRFARGMNLTAGARYDHYSDFGGTVNPRLGLVWSFSEQGDAKLLYGRAFRAPNFKELYDQNNSFSVGNPSLQPETIDTYEASLEHALGGRTRAGLNYFHSRIENLIDRDATPPVPHFANKGKAEVNGVEAVFTGKLSEADSWKAGYTYQKAENADTGRPLPSVPSHRATAGVNHAFSRGINCYVGALWTGARPRADGDARPKSAPYSTVDAALSASGFFRTNLAMRVAVHNLFDRRFRDPDTSGAAGLIPNDFPREGLFATVDLSYAF